MKTIILLLISISVWAQSPYVYVLGIAQDGGYPQAGCQKNCCKPAWNNYTLRQNVSSIAIIDPQDHSAWIVDATPDFKNQYQLLLNHDPKIILKGILLTHAHIGHYTGLMHLGREVMGSKEIAVYAMPKMADYLSKNGPWSQLVTLQNIKIMPIQKDSTFKLNDRISVQAWQVPHRDEFSETVGYQINTNIKKLFFLPDIDKWTKWQKSIADIVLQHDYTLLDGTFYKDGEISRPMAEVPHPFVSETVSILATLSKSEKQKVHFIHLNHTNPLLNAKSTELQELKNAGYRLAKEKMILKL